MSEGKWLENLSSSPDRSISSHFESGPFQINVHVFEVQNSEENLFSVFDARKQEAEFDKNWTTKAQGFGAQDFNPSTQILTENVPFYKF